MLVNLIRTLHPHWGPHSGLNPFTRNVAAAGLEIDEQIVPMGRGNLPRGLSWLRLPVRLYSRVGGAREYDLHDLIAELAVLNKWRQGRVDLVHYLDGEHSLQFLPSLMRRLRHQGPRPPVLATFHQPPEELDMVLNRRAVRLLDQVVVVSPVQAAYFEQMLPSSQVAYLPLGIDVDYFHPAPEARNRGRFMCLSVGFWMRASDILLEVADRLRGHADIEFHVVSSHVEAPHHLSNLSLHRDVSDARLLALYQQADVLFLPLDSATANCALLEGLACGLPVVATDLVSLRGYLPEEAGILVPDNDPDLFSQAILRLRDDADLRAAMAKAARRRATVLSWAEVGAGYRALYQRLLDGPGSAR